MPLSFVSTELLKSHRTNSDEGSSAKPRLSSVAPETILSGRGNLPRTERPRDNRADMDRIIIIIIIMAPCQNQLFKA
jgi:hypothetical protein